MELQIIIKDLKEICKKENLDVDSNCLFENAIKIMISNNINKSKKENIANYQKDKVGQNKDSELDINKPTYKQIAALKKMGKYKEGLTKKDAWKIISESKK